MEGTRRARLDRRLDRRGGRRRRSHVRRGGRALRGARARALSRAVLLHRRPRLARASGRSPSRRRRRGGRAGHLHSARSSPTSTPPTGSRSSAGMGSTSSRGPSGRCWPRATRRARSASSAEATPDAALPSRASWRGSGAACSQPSRSRRAASHGVRSSMRSSTHRRASSSEGRSVSTRPFRTRWPMRIPGSSSPARSRSGQLGASPKTTSKRPIAAAAAKASAAEAAVQVCETAIQVHGGIGFTWEHVLHRLYKRALWIESFGASGTTLRAEVAASLLDSAGQGVWLQPDPGVNHPRRLRWTA